MNPLYDRRETAEQIEFEFHGMPLVSGLFLVLILASLSPGCCCSKLRPACAVVMILWVIGLLPAWVELEKAMQAGTVTVSGSKISFAHPLRVTITRN
jgi:hypothetical protein